MIRLVRTNSDDPDFRKLIIPLDKYLAQQDGDDHAFYAQYNKPELIKYVLVAYDNNDSCGCGALKPFDESTVEIKRMYTVPEHRGKGIASLVLKELEQWAHELSYKKCILETGKKQTEAIALYTKNGYEIMPNYGQYTGVDYSLCFQKILNI